MGVKLEKSALESAALQYTSVETDGGDALRSKAVQDIAAIACPEKAGGGR
jgi:hypothetical protein